MMTAKLRQHSLSNLVHDCNLNLASLRQLNLNMGTTSDGPQLRKEIEQSIKTYMRSCEATKNCVLPHLRNEGSSARGDDETSGVSDFTKYASQFIGCVSACVVEMRRCDALEQTFPQPDAPANIAAPHIPSLEQVLDTLENLITVHFSTSESAPETKVTPRRRRLGGTCRPQCMCSKLKTSYA